MSNEHARVVDDQPHRTRAQAIGGDLSGEALSKQDDGHSHPNLPHTMLNRPQVRGRGSGAARTSTIQRMQQTYGNRAVQRWTAGEQDWGTTGKYTESEVATLLKHRHHPMDPTDKLTDAEVDKANGRGASNKRTMAEYLTYEKKHKGGHHAHPASPGGTAGPMELPPISITADPPQARQDPGDGGTYSGIVTGGSPWIEVPGSTPPRLPRLVGPNVVLP